MPLVGAWERNLVFFFWRDFSTNSRDPGRDLEPDLAGRLLKMAEVEICVKWKSGSYTISLNGLERSGSYLKSNVFSFLARLFN
jgi:hypothetical protein